MEIKKELNSLSMKSENMKVLELKKPEKKDVWLITHPIDIRKFLFLLPEFLPDGQQYIHHIPFQLYPED